MMVLVADGDVDVWTFVDVDAESFEAVASRGLDRRQRPGHFVHHVTGPVGQLVPGAGITHRTRDRFGVGV